MGQILDCNLNLLVKHAKFQNPRTIPSRRKVTGSDREKKKRERKTLLIMATKFCLQRPNAAHALRLDQHQDTNLLLILLTILLYCL